jgi:hypothetical protein
VEVGVVYTVEDSLRNSDICCPILLTGNVTEYDTVDVRLRTTALTIQSLCLMVSVFLNPLRRT